MGFDEEADLGDGEAAANEGVGADGGLDDDTDESAFYEEDDSAVDDDAPPAAAVASRAASPTVDGAVESAAQAPPIAADAISPAAVGPPVFVVLDTSAVVRMVERGSSAAAVAPFTFANFGVSNLRGGVVWILLDTVLQQLDDSKRA